MTLEILFLAKLTKYKLKINLRSQLIKRNIKKSGSRLINTKNSLNSRITKNNSFIACINTFKRTPLKILLNQLIVSRSKNKLNKKKAK